MNHPFLSRLIVESFFGILPPLSSPPTDSEMSEAAAREFAKSLPTNGFLR